MEQQPVHVIVINLLGDEPRCEIVKSDHSSVIVKSIIRYDINDIRYCQGEDAFAENGCIDRDMMDRSYDFFCSLIGINIKNKPIIVDRIVMVDAGVCEHF